ncbi:hypothetical protein [Spirosoma sordidisoli]|uniref:Uncharacterized protein n=1 Tax=Spirosoma sordidisoli TaxID=2502893 RepID=A0A4V1RVK1_9BACT|nr:hypothetical protein [Spirosoma sordidisoli]RYC67048.1 hypothetical protein EQG79_27135 [Spirosoma sordidisoli]
MRKQHVIAGTMLILSTMGLMSCQKEQEVTPTETEQEVIQTTDNSAIEEGAIKFTLIKPALLRLSHLQQAAVNYKTIDDLLNYFKVNGTKPSGLFFNGDKIADGRGDSYSTLKPAEIQLANNQRVTQSSMTRSADTLLLDKIIDNTKSTTALPTSVSFTKETGYAIYHTTTSLSYITQPLDVKLKLHDSSIQWKIFGGGKDNNVKLSATKPVNGQWLVNVPAGKKLKISVYKVKVTRNYTYQVFMDLGGQVSAYFSTPQRGKNYLGLPAINFWTGILPNARPSQKGTVTSQQYEYVIKRQFI